MGKNHSLEVGMSFGITSATITTLGLIVGLNAATSSRVVVIGGILTIAIADAFSDALGIHISEESEGVHTKKQIWASTFSTFMTKLIFALTFLIPFLIFDLATSISIDLLWGFLLIGLLSFYIAKSEKQPAWEVVGEHLVVGVIVIFATNFVGNWIAAIFA